MCARIMCAVLVMPAPDYHFASHSSPSPRVTCDVSEPAPERAIPMGSEQDRTGVSRIWSRGVWDTGQRWLFSLAAAPAWWGGRSWTGRLPPVATRTYPAGSQTSSMASALRCVAVVLSREKSRLIHCFCVLYCTKYFFSKNSLISSF